ncbi:ABC transporter permease [Mucilaginibacter sp. L3T2-6]|uniref:ABC transporter permease n=1 Tax=Mucilaginibacter sp. L3T2-6 TaxID=3062491 RepID=UPI002674D290|nr:ABC transporter permease [Mucilaginibacter sp. L3T2-6]MDO3643993.1 ABC transporter permease [Mucilaginibacter sp. L3T2-6]MDV6216444.1 ABC transporter permease [Mucilaginibacter sp. L3T2-6]
MIKNYIKTAFRGLMKNKGFTFINVFGLALGLATCLLIVFYVFDELNFDSYNEKAERIYRVNNNIKFGGNENSYAVSPAPAAAALKADFPEVEEAVRFRNRGGNQVKKGKQNIVEDRMVYADNSIFKIFTLPIVSGSADNALTAPHTVVITEKMAKKYFDRTNVVGQTLTFNDPSLYKVTAVIKDIPKQSHFNFDFFIAMPGLDESKEDAWLSNNFNTYVLLKPGADINRLKGKMREFMVKHAGPQMQSLIHLSYDDFEKAGNYYKFDLVPLRSIHLHSNSVAELDVNGDIKYVYIFSGVAILILLIACVNFMNLSTARSSNRAREVGVRKVLGSPRKHLIAQFLTESILVTLFATLIALVIAWLFLPQFNKMSGKDLVVTGQIISWLLPTLLVIILVIGCLAGSYPALYMSAFQPIQVLKGKIAAGFKGSMFRNVLVVGQFCISIFLIISTLVIYNQLKYIQSKDLGYTRDHVLVIKNVWSLGNGAKSFRDEVKTLAGVQDASLTGALPTDDYGNSSAFFKTPNLDQKQSILSQIWPADENYLPTLGIKIIAGRNFSKEIGTDTAALIINEAAAKQLGFTDPIGQFIYTPNDNMAKTIKKYHVVGVMRDFNFRSLKENISPLMLRMDEDRGAVTARIRSANIPAIIQQIKNKYDSFSPTQAFAYSFMDEDFDAIYRAEQRIGTISVAFTSLAIIIACLGLFGLAAYAAEQRIKEIGIRKVLGANVSAIVGMLSKDFIKLVLVSILVATPLAWWAMHNWLQGFAYRQSVQWWILALAGGGAIIIAFATISFQSIKAALTNPVKSLKSE